MGTRAATIGSDFIQNYILFRTTFGLFADMNRDLLGFFSESKWAESRISTRQNNIVPHEKSSKFLTCGRSSGAARAEHCAASTTPEKKVPAQDETENEHSAATIKHRRSGASRRAVSYTLLTEGIKTPRSPIASRLADRNVTPFFRNSSIYKEPGRMSPTSSNTRKETQRMHVVHPDPAATRLHMQYLLQFCIYTLYVSFLAVYLLLAFTGIQTQDLRRKICLRRATTHHPSAGSKRGNISRDVFHS